MFIQSYDLHSISYKMTRVKNIANLHESIFQKLFKTIIFFYLRTTHFVKSWNVILTHTNHLTGCCIIQIVWVFVDKQRHTFNVLFKYFNTMACKYVNQNYVNCHKRKNKYLNFNNFTDYYNFTWLNWHILSATKIKKPGDLFT